jgi:zeaxanthin glucosyltransferase
MVFLTFHGLSHFNACFRIARLLAKDHDVVFAGHPAFRGYVEAQGFRYYTLESLPFGLGFEEWVNEQDKKGKVWIRSLRDRWSQRLFKQRERELKNLLNILQPAQILVDAQQVTDFVVLYPHASTQRVRLSILHTFLPQVLRKGYPPGNSIADPKHKLSVAFSRIKYRTSRAIRVGWSAIRYAGKTNRSMVLDMMKANGTTLSYLSASVSQLSVHIAGPEEFILVPKEFDFSSSIRTSREHYIGFMPDFGRTEINTAILAELLNKLDKNNEPLIYCSFGTVRGADQELMIQFIRKFTQAVAGEAFVVAISTMAFGDYPTKGLPANVYLFNPAPQLALLQRASVFVSHGGINSIKESIYAGVPMLIYPRDPRMDQNGNAARVKFHKLGLHGHLQSDTPRDILKKIKELLKDPGFKTRVNAFRVVDERYSDEHFLNLFDQVKPLG